MKTLMAAEETAGRSRAIEKKYLVLSKNDALELSAK